MTADQIISRLQKIQTTASNRTYALMAAQAYYKGIAALIEELEATQAPTRPIEERFAFGGQAIAR